MLSAYSLLIVFLLLSVPLLAHASELTSLSLSDQSLQKSEGPSKQVTAWRSTKPTANVRVPLPTAVSGQGSLMFWLDLDRVYSSGTAGEKYRQNLVNLPGVVEIVFRADKAQVAIETRWHKEGGGHQYTATILPGLPQGWVHLAWRWNAGKGRIEPFVNGSPLRPSDADYVPWKSAGAADHIELTPGRFGLADVRIGSGAFTDIQVRQMVGPIYRGSLDHLLGLRDRGRFDMEPFKGELIYENALRRPQDIATWPVEGPAAIVSIDADGLFLSTKPSTGPDDHMVIWCDQTLPADFVAQWTTQMVDTTSLNIFFFCALGRTGKDIFDPSLQKRDGIFPFYHSGDIDCYHISYYAFDRATSHLRKNHGFYLTENGPIGIPSKSKEEHKLMLMKKGSHIVFTVDGRLLIDFLDDGQMYGKVLGAGKFGLRQMNGAKARYRDLKVFQIKK